MLCDELSEVTIKIEILLFGGSGTCGLEIRGR
jgi:hypothetical protein